jgi:hypothetical protein
MSEIMEFRRLAFLKSNNDIHNIEEGIKEDLIEDRWVRADCIPSSDRSLKCFNIRPKGLL